MTNIYINLKFRVWKHDMPGALEKISVNSVNLIILYTVTNIYPKAGFY